MARFAGTLFLVSAFCLTWVSCSQPQGRVMEDSEQDYVGARTAGAETFDRLVAGTVEKLLQGQSAARAGTGRLPIAVLPVENASGEEIGDWQEQIYELISTSILKSDRYSMVSRRFVEQALREGRLRPEQLFIPGPRRAFLEILETAKSPAELLLFPKLTSGTTNADEGTRQRNYLLTLELVEVESGTIVAREAERVRKAYTR